MRSMCTLSSSDLRVYISVFPSVQVALLYRFGRLVDASTLPSRTPSAVVVSLHLVSTPQRVPTLFRSARLRAKERRSNNQLASRLQFSWRKGDTGTIESSSVEF
jgi:hypothetical protein